MISTSLKLSLVADNVDPCNVNQGKSGQDGTIFILFKRKISINQLTLSIYTKNGIKVAKMAKEHPQKTDLVKKFGKWPRFSKKSPKTTTSITYRGVPTPSSYSGSLSLR